MNFSRLLAAGKSMVGMKNQNCPYRMRAENLLPKFESTKNPFAAKRTVPASATVAPVVAPVMPAIMETRPLFTPDLKPAVPIVMTEKVASVVAPVAATPISAVAEKSETPEPLLEPKPEAEPVPVKIIHPAAEVVIVPVMPMSEAAAPVKSQKVYKIPVTTPPVGKKPEAKPFALGGFLKKLNPVSYLIQRNLNQAKACRAPVQTELSLERIKVMCNDLHESDLEVISTKVSAKPATPSSRMQAMVKTETAALSRMTTKFFGAEETQVR